MLPKIHRLTKKKDFDLVYKKGESVKNSFLVCRMLKNHSTDPNIIKESRFGFVVSKKVSIKATIRNKVRRRLGQAVLAQLKFTKQIGQTKPVDVIIIALPGIEKKEFLDIGQAINDSFKKLKLI